MTDSLLQAARDIPGTTVCPFCGSGCSILLNGAAAFPRLRHRVSQGALCLRGWSAGELTSSPLRLTTAYARVRGHVPEPLPVERAVEDVVRRLHEIRTLHGGASIGILGSARITVEEAVLLRRLAAAIGTPHLDTLQRIGYLPFAPVTLDDLEGAASITVLGANLTVRQPQVGRRVLRAVDRGAHVRFVHSRRVQLASLGARHDVALPGHELDALGPVARGEIVVLSSEIALAGQGAEAWRRLRHERAMFLTDYANQRGVIEAGLHPSPDGLSAWEMLRAAADGALKALVVFADDPFEFFPALAARAFARADLVVVVDAIATTSARRADVVLPGALPSEKFGTLVNAEAQAQEIRPCSAPPAGWTEGRVATRLIERLGPDADPAPPSRFVPGSGGLLADRPGAGYPFLAALDTTLFWNSHALVAGTVTAWREMRNLFADFPPGCVTLNPADARNLGIHATGPVTITSSDGSVTLPARLHPRMSPGTVWIAMPCWERCGEKLGALEFDPSLRIPVFRPRAVRVSRAEGA